MILAIYYMDVSAVDCGPQNVVTNCRLYLTLIISARYAELCLRDDVRNSVAKSRCGCIESAFWFYFLVTGAVPGWLASTFFLK